MQFRSSVARPEGTEGLFRRVVRYAFYDWTREMPKSKRYVTTAALTLQGYALYALWSRSLVWPWIWPKGYFLYPAVFLLYYFGYVLMNVMLTSEFVRKTQLESDQIAARQIQQTLIPQKLDSVPGYEVESFYQPFRDVGGDYFDVIGLPDNRTLFAVADVSGKGMPAALLSANIQALVRSIAGVTADPLSLVRQINQHLSRYTPGDRFATAVFLVLDQDSGRLTYVNAGHNPPMIHGAGSSVQLEATGIPLGLLGDTPYEVCTAVLPRGGTLVLFTDGLTDSIAAPGPEDFVRQALAESAEKILPRLRSLVDPKLNHDDVTILLVKRT